MSKIDVFLMDNSNNIKEQASFTKPKNYTKLLSKLKKHIKNIPKIFELFILDENNKEKKIDNEEKYKLIGDRLFIREIDDTTLRLSLFERNYKKLPESKKEELEQEYNCVVCYTIIKNENPFFCYKCQKIIHEKCLKDWDNKCKSQNQNLTCPHCRIELPLEKWIRKLDFEESRKKTAELIGTINENKLKRKMSDNINTINIRKMNELKNNEIKQNELIKKYEKYFEDIKIIFKHILNEVNSIINLLNVDNDDNSNKFNADNLDFEKIPKLIMKELKIIKNYILSKNNNNEINISINENNNNNIESSNDSKISEYINKINLIYYAKNEGDYNIFGEKFEKNNKDDIELIINGKNNTLISKSSLKKGENLVTMIIKKNAINLSYMFYYCNILKDISDLKYLEVSNSQNFEHMFYGCSSITDLKPLESWDVSKGNNFNNMFNGCSSVKNIKPLKNWDVSNGQNFKCMFYGCTSLTDLKPLENWNFWNCKDFSGMFNRCSSLSNIQGLESWNVSNSKNFEYMFYECTSIKDIKPLGNWNVSNVNSLSDMFSGCSSLTNIKALENWDVSNIQNFRGMFNECSSLSDIKPLKNWNVSNGVNFESMFSECSSLSDIKPLKLWNVSKGKNFENMFYGVSSLSDINPLKFWNISKDVLKNIK